ncbi:hypothetical protein CUC08_Gglean013452 [Alternaria sp. MG1]|jgi:hypothetical protein|nr:hypothetical protein CUC08_Gglean013452 [Alternaria sp. MG1]
MNDTFLNRYGQGRTLASSHHPAYSSIDSENRDIRLLELCPALYDDTIQLRLRPKKANEKTDYEALSYTWGTTTSPREALLSGTPISVTESLDLCLRRLRYADRSRILWVDALCINQDDIQERSKQVQLMAMIYSSAKNVLIWLGEWVPSATCVDQERCEKDFSKLLAKSRRINSVFAAYSSSAGFLRKTSQFLMSSALTPELYHSLGHLLDIILGPWFRRIWVIQEFVLAKKDPVVHIGLHCARWQDLFYAIQGSYYALQNKSYSEKTRTPGLDFFDLYLEIQICALSIWTLNMMRNEGEKNRSLSWLLRHSYHSEATDPRDNVYGLLGICHFSEADPIVPDYTKSLLQVLAEATVVEIIEESPEHYLTYFNSVPHEAFGPNVRTPSWIMSYARIDLEDREYKKPSLKSRERRHGSIRLSEDHQTLFTQGRYVGTISAVLSCPYTPNNKEIDDARSMAAKVYGFYHKMLKASNITPQRLYKMLAYNHRLDRGLYDFVTCLLGTEDGFVDMVVENGTKLLADHRSLMITQEGDLALAWHESGIEVKVGDIVANLFGYNIPFILRPIEFRASVYRMVNVASSEGHRSHSWLQLEAEQMDEYAIE